MLRLLSYVFCVAAFLWLGLESLQFRRSIRSSLSNAYALMHRVDPEHADDAGKVLNSYYEDVYRDLPAIVVPACLLMLGSTALLLLRRAHKAGTCAASNGGRAAPVEKPSVTEEPPAVN
jgi:hypothetical protein